MGKAFLFTGDPHVGKSTAVQAVIKALEVDSISRLFGFVTHEQVANSYRTGFAISMLDGRTGRLASKDMYSPFTVGSYGVDLGFLENVAIPSIYYSLDEFPQRIVVIDEIGPMQLFSKAFRELILRILDLQDATLFGSVVHRSIPWIDSLKSRSEVQTFLLTETNRSTLAAMMGLYLRELGSHLDQYPA